MPLTKEIIDNLAEKFGTNRESLIPIMQGIVEAQNYLSKEAMIALAEKLDVSAAEVYGTASFYSFLDTEPRGKYRIRICKSIICEMKGKNEILRTIEDVIKIKVGETSKGERFSLLSTNCLGWCAEGPAMLVNDKVYTKLTPKKVRTILGDLLREEKA